MHTSGFWPTDSTASCSSDAAPAAGPVCAIHQPNLFPRLSTLAKLFAADVWIVLDDVQFARRDYQHRARLAPAAGTPGLARWLSIPTHLPAGRATLIRDARVVAPVLSRHRIADLLREHYRTTPHWAAFKPRLEVLLDVFERTDRTGTVAQESTLLLLSMVGWSGRVVVSSDLNASTNRSQRLADLCSAVGAATYLCGTGGMRYIEPAVFDRAAVQPRPFAVPNSGLWAGASRTSAVAALTAYGPQRLAELLEHRAAARSRTSRSAPPWPVPLHEPVPARHVHPRPL
ncbi:WbqC family protein [Streptomyces sp. NRRL WC-3742]|uniref:WbqC family protein n=1 Tax=Streptomyces sp. NRRL WC-3742 TaxID=1463934 RepID=UPI00099BDCF3|nr:WbqC family protein [Streptomyces sp. NRRL WC-3742]